MDPAKQEPQIDIKFIINIITLKMNLIVVNNLVS